MMSLFAELKGIDIYRVLFNYLTEHGEYIA